MGVYNMLGAEAYARKVSIGSFNTYIDMAAPLNGLIFDAVYGRWILSLPLFTLGIIVLFVFNITHGYFQALIMAASIV